VALSLPRDQLYTIGWRIVFWSGIITTAVGLALRAGLLRESPEWEVGGPGTMAPVRELFARGVREPFLVVLNSYYGMVLLILHVPPAILNDPERGFEHRSSCIWGGTHLYGCCRRYGIPPRRPLSRCCGEQACPRDLGLSIYYIYFIYSIVYTLLAGNPWAMLLWDFAVVGPVGIFQLYKYDNDPPESEGYSSWARL